MDEHKAFLLGLDDGSRDDQSYRERRSQAEAVGVVFTFEMEKAYSRGEYLGGSLARGAGLRGSNIQRDEANARRR